MEANRSISPTTTRVTLGGNAEGNETCSTSRSQEVLVGVGSRGLQVLIRPRSNGYIGLYFGIHPACLKSGTGERLSRFTLICHILRARSLPLPHTVAAIREGERHAGE